MVRVVWLTNRIICQYTTFIHLDLNPNSAYEFYDIEITGRPENNTKVTILMFMAIMFFFIAYKYRYIEMWLWWWEIDKFLSREIF